VARDDVDEVDPERVAGLVVIDFFFQPWDRYYTSIAFMYSDTVLSHRTLMWVNGIWDRHI
jgi:hypothetical protein